MTTRCLLARLLLVACCAPLAAEESRLLRQPALGADRIAFVYGGDLWTADLAGGDVRRLTSTPAVESDPHFSPDGSRIAFTSNRSGTPAAYLLPVDGGQPQRLSWYPAPAYVRGFTPDGRRVLYASTRETAPDGYDRLWTVSVDGGPPERLPAPWGHDGSYSPDGKRIVVDRVQRWDREWRHYRGGQNTPLVILDLATLDELRLPNDRTTDVRPVWLGDTVYFLSDRDWVMNVWSYRPGSAELRQVTDFDRTDVKWLDGRDGTLIVEHDGYVHTLDPASGRTRKIPIELRGDFPWADPRWVEIGEEIRSASLSATGKRALFEARGEIFTVPAEKGDPRNLTRSSGAADRAPVWSPDGGRVAWFSDAGDGYVLLIADQDGLADPQRIPIGASKMAWDTTWSPDGSRIAFVDDDVRVRVVELETGEVTTADVGGANVERGEMGICWSPDSKWLAYARSFPNRLRRIVVWSLDDGRARPITDSMADAFGPSWDRDGEHLYLLASTDVALGSGWANTSRMGVDPTYAPYVVVLAAEQTTPFAPESDEEQVETDDEAGGDSQEQDEKKKKKKKDEEDDEKEDEETPVVVRIDFDGIERRIIPLPIDRDRYTSTAAGPKGSVFIGRRVPGERDGTVHKFTLEDREEQEFLDGVRSFALSSDGTKLLYRNEESWFIVGTDKKPEAGDGKIDVTLRARIDRLEEWRQIFDEAWRYQRDFFYDPAMHGRDWDDVRARYEPLVPHVRHRADLSYVLDQMNGELSVGHSFVFGGDMPQVETSRVGVLGADLVVDRGRFKIDRIYTFESWNPEMKAPLDRPGLRVEVGHYIVAIEGSELTSADDPYRLLDGTADRQITLHVNDQPSMDGAWTATVVPIGSEDDLRQRAWVEDNRRRVDELSGGRLAYVWVPNTGEPGVISFNRYFFAQQDREGAVIDERFNGGGLLDDYMVDLMTRELRAAITNEVPDGEPFRLPAGILGPKVLLINELAGSGGDFFPWVFRRQRAGPLIGTRTWGGLVKSSVHYPLVDGGALTAPDNAVFDPAAGEWIAENAGIAPDIEVLLDAKSVADGRDPQLERGVRELLRLLD
ncbi:MAG TPA: PDZ domain-containing protein, partial [Candidatus Polarisedimenticolaceae bacterium]|nr:PDZ domain-containing protein [Candidatus Polarisedimenticolaceae bacterium]